MQQKKVAQTPMMRQYFQIKKKYPDAILLFRVGDFYETFLEDAVIASEILGITLTRRANGSASHVELAGFPHHALDSYLPKLVRAGKRVAVCDQLEDPKKTNKLVKRGLTELVTPGVAVGDAVLENKENNFLCAIYTEKNVYGIAFLDYSTGEFVVAQEEEEEIRKLIAGYQPKEILVEHKSREQIEQMLGAFAAFLHDYDDWIFSVTNNRERLLRHFETQTLKGFGIDEYPLAITSAGAILNYLDLTKHQLQGHINTISRIDHSSYVRMDNFTLYSLELLQPMNAGGKSLLQVLDKTLTPMGGRLLRKVISFPLRSVAEIHKRQEVVQDFYDHPQMREELSLKLAEVGDLERLVSRLAMRRVTPRELLRLAQVLQLLEPIVEICRQGKSKELKQLIEGIDLVSNTVERLQYSIHPEASNSVSKGQVIAAGVSEELDNLRHICYHSQEYLLVLQEKESAETGITSLKIGFNNVFGYYLEVRDTHKDKVPANWIRKQTLVSAERYITQELKEYEERILGAQERILDLETQLFNDLIEQLQESVTPLLRNCTILARLDMLLSFSLSALEHDYVRPTVDESLDIKIEAGRHPVIELQLEDRSHYIPNSITLDPQDTQIAVITGPNMSGKSALLRQTALIVLMAQIGSFVPAASAQIGFVDAIFTRVGASDNISRGESTFMVEMQEAANILNSLTDRSLVLFDELGRGTSTFDGISIAWAIIEYLHNRPLIRPKTLFATHYHELNEIEGILPRVRNFNVSAKEIDGKMLFLRKLEPGGSEHSFGIQVAQLAGMPKWIITRASEILKTLESERIEDGITQSVGAKTTSKSKKTQNPQAIQMTLFQLEDPLLIQIRDELLDLALEHITPMQAMRKLEEIKAMLKDY